MRLIYDYETVVEPIPYKWRRAARVPFCCLLVAFSCSLLWGQENDATQWAELFANDYSFQPDIEYGVADNIPLKLDVWERQDTVKPVPTVVYIHGGGWVFGAKAGADTLHGDHDPTVPYSHAVRLHEKLQTVGVPNQFVTIKGGLHGSFNDAETEDAYRQIWRFFGANVTERRRTGVVDDNFFPYKDNWLGADSAYSIPLDRFSTLWLLGDTFVGAERKTSRMIHNSIAIRTCRDGCQVSYWWSGMRSGQPDSFFKTPDTNYYWPLDGFTDSGKLYIFLEQMHATGAGGAFGFDYSGIELASVSNPLAQPKDWVVSYRSISPGGKAIPGVAAAVVEDSGQKYADVFTLFRQSPAHPFVGLLRCRLVDLASSHEPHWEYLTSDSHWANWTPSSSPNDAAQLIEGNITEMTVKHHPEQQRWLAVFPSPTGLSNTAFFSQANQPSGPWTKPTAFFTYPEMQKTDSRFTPNVFCYAAKEHPELETGGNFSFTYACNSLHESEVFSDMRLYRPEVVTITEPLAVSPGR